MSPYLFASSISLSSPSYVLALWRYFGAGEDGDRIRIVSAEANSTFCGLWNLRSPNCNNAGSDVREAESALSELSGELRRIRIGKLGKATRNMRRAVRKCEKSPWRAVDARWAPETAIYFDRL